MPSPFLTPGPLSAPGDLAILHLRRDLMMPAILEANEGKEQDQEEKVTNTRYGSFPHSTLIGQQWGSQISASKVDTGSRSRKSKKKQQQLKRKAQELESPGATDDAASSQAGKTAVSPDSGFIHLLPPSPEFWTASLPHRTQVVYTPDYSYILHRLRVRPGSTIIEAGAGSGSFTHAATRAVFNGYPEYQPPAKKQRLGKVYSYEFHAQRAQKIQEEIQQHGLEGLVEVTHRDVYTDGFLVGEPKTGRSPRANAVFLDLPAPWLALKHLVRNPADGSESPLDPSSPVHICTFSPCLEQAQKTISTLRQNSWVSISMVEVNQRRIEVRRERYGLDAEGPQGGVTFPKSVDEAVDRMRQVEQRQREYRRLQNQQRGAGNAASPEAAASGKDEQEDREQANPRAAAASTMEGTDETATGGGSSTTAAKRPAVPSYELGRLYHKTEPDLKTHTSYLVFAVLPCAWSEEDERRCREAWPSRKADKDSVKEQGRGEKAEKKQDQKVSQDVKEEAESAMEVD